MTPAELISWRSRMGLTAKDAASQLGLSQNGYAAYERGYVADNLAWGTIRLRPIPRHVALACKMLELEQITQREEIPLRVRAWLQGARIL